MVEVLTAAERQCVQDFCQRVAFPSYSACAEILRGDIELWAEFGEIIHELLHEIYRSGFAEEGLIRESGTLILRRGGQQALWASSSALNRIMCHLVHRSNPDVVMDEAVIDPTTGGNMIVRTSMVLCNANEWFVDDVWKEVVEATTKLVPFFGDVDFVAAGGLGHSDIESDGFSAQRETIAADADSQQLGPVCSIGDSRKGSRASAVLQQLCYLFNVSSQIGCTASVRPCDVIKLLLLLLLCRSMPWSCIES